MNNKVATRKTPIWLTILIVICTICGLLILVGRFYKTLDKSNPRGDITVTMGEIEKVRSLGSVIVNGSVKNYSDSYTYKYVQVRATIFGKDGDQIGTDTTYIDSDSLPPKAKSTFTVYVDCDIDDASRIDLSIED